MNALLPLSQRIYVVDVTIESITELIERNTNIKYNVLIEKRVENGERIILGGGRNMSIKTKVKGNRIQRKVIAYFQKRGYIVSKVEMQSMYAKERDLFGLFDLIALRSDAISLVQVTCNRPHTHKKYMEFSKEYRLKDVYYEQWVWIDRKGWKIFLYRHGKKFKTDMPHD